MAAIDITIRGAGIFGLSAAWACTQRGARVQVIDPYGVGAGSSGGVVGALAPHVPENWNAKKAFQLESLLMAQDFWNGVEAVGGVSAGYGRTGRLQPLNDPRALELARQREGTARQLWGDAASWTVCDAGSFGEWCPPSTTGFVVHDTLSGRMHPRKACAALSAALRARGVEIQVEGVDQGLVLHTKGWAGLIELCDTFGKVVGNGVKGQAAVLDYDARHAPQLYADALHLIPHGDGTVAIGSTSEREFDDAKTTDDQLEDVIARAIRAMPQLANARVIERWAGVRPRAKSRAPMLGRWPSRTGHFIANGGFKIGFGMAPKVGAVMADLMLEGQDVIPQGFRVEDNL